MGLQRRPLTEATNRHTHPNAFWQTCNEVCTQRVHRHRQRHGREYRSTRTSTSACTYLVTPKCPSTSSSTPTLTQKFTNCGLFRLREEGSWLVCGGGLLKSRALTWHVMRCGLEFGGWGRKSMCGGSQVGMHLKRLWGRGGGMATDALPTRKHPVLAAFPHTNCFVQVARECGQSCAERLSTTLGCRGALEGR